MARAKEKSKSAQVGREKRAKVPKSGVARDRRVLQHDVAEAEYIQKRCGSCHQDGVCEGRK